MPTDVEAAAEPLRETLKADGADLELLREEAGTAYFRLDLEHASCKECVMPRDTLERMALVALRRQIPELQAVHIEDPRDPQGGVA